MTPRVATTDPEPFRSFLHRQTGAYGDLARDLDADPTAPKAGAAETRRYLFERFGEGAPVVDVVDRALRAWRRAHGGGAR